MSLATCHDDIDIGKLNDNNNNACNARSTSLLSLSVEYLFFYMRREAECRSRVAVCRTCSARA